MDRSKWEYKKLGEVCEILDKLRKPVTKSDRVAGQYPYYGATGIQDYVANYIFDGRYLLLGEDGAKWGANDRSAFIIEGKTWVNNHAHILKINSDYMDVFVMYYLNHKDLSEYITGAVVPKLTQAAMAKIPVPYINIADQQRIVAELDCLNEMIALKQEQLKEFDKLAQSIFYDMFGDPSMNDKGWDVATLKSICTKITDGTHDTPKRITSGVKFITGKHIRPFYVDYDNSDYVTEDVHREIYSRCNPEFGDVLYTNIGAGVGNAALNTVEYEFSMKNVALLKPKQDLVCGLYITHYLNEPGIKKTIIDNHTNGGAQIFLSLKAIGDIPVSLPPLALQQQFAEKIQAIEAQKELVKKSIAETQHLLDSRMDYFFD